MSPPSSVATPPLTFHLGLPPLPASTHFDKSLPSNSTIASDGGLPASPGATTFGSTHLMPLRYSSPTMRVTNAAHATIATNGKTRRRADDMVGSPKRRVYVEIGRAHV